MLSRSRASCLRCSVISVNLLKNVTHHSTSLFLLSPGGHVVHNPFSRACELFHHWQMCCVKSVSGVGRRPWKDENPDVWSVPAGWRRGVQRAADQDSLHGPSGGAHHPAPDLRQQSRALPLRGEAPTGVFCPTRQPVSEQRGSERVENKRAPCSHV